MQRARIVGQGVATVKHPSLVGWRLLLAQPLGRRDQADGEPLLVLDRLGARIGDEVLLTSDGAGARELVGVRTSPARWFVLGICDRCTRTAG